MRNQASFMKFSCVAGMFRASRKAKVAISQRSILLIVKSKLVLQEILIIPNINKTKSDNLMESILRFISASLHL